MNTLKMIFKVIWSLVLILIAVASFYIYLPMDIIGFLMFYFPYHFVLAPLLVILFSKLLKKKTFLVVPITLLMYLIYNIGKGILMHYGILVSRLESPSLIHTMSYAFWTNGEFMLEFIFREGLFFVWLCIYTITYYVYDLDK